MSELRAASCELRHLFERVARAEAAAKEKAETAREAEEKAI